MSEKKPYYRKRKGSVKTKPSEAETNATSLDATSSTTPASDLGVAGTAQTSKPKKKRYPRKPKSRLATEAEAWAVTQQSIADTDSDNAKFHDAVTATVLNHTADNTIDWRDAVRALHLDAVRSTAAERGIDQMGLPALPKETVPAEDAKSKNSNNTAVKEAMHKHNNIMRDKIKYNSYSDNNTDEDDKRYKSKSDLMLREHKLISALALAIVFLASVCALSVWYMLMK